MPYTGAKRSGANGAGRVLTAVRVRSGTGVKKRASPHAKAFHLAASRPRSIKGYKVPPRQRAAISSCDNSSKAQVGLKDCKDMGMSCSTDVAPLTGAARPPRASRFPDKSRNGPAQRRESTMHHHQLIGIDDLTKLTTRELRELDARLCQIIDHEPDLTDRDIAVILVSLTNIRAVFDLRHMALSKRGEPI